MPASAAQQARRAFVKVLLALAAVYGVALSLSQRASDADLVAGYRKLVRRVHPDKGGSVQDMQRLQGAKDAWEDAKCGASAGRPRAGAGSAASGPASQPQATAGQGRHRDGGGQSGPVLPEAELEVADPREVTRGYRSQGVFPCSPLLLPQEGIDLLASCSTFHSS